MCLVTQSCLSLWFHELQPARLLCPWGFSRQEYWSRLPCLPPRDLPNLGIKPRSSTLYTDSIQSELPEKTSPSSEFSGSQSFHNNIKDHHNKYDDNEKVWNLVGNYQNVRHMKWANAAGKTVPINLFIVNCHKPLNFFFFLKKHLRRTIKQSMP